MLFDVNHSVRKVLPETPFSKQINWISSILFPVEELDEVFLSALVATVAGVNSDGFNASKSVLQVSNELHLLVELIVNLNCLVVLLDIHFIDLTVKSVANTVDLVGQHCEVLVHSFNY